MKDDFRPRMPEHLRPWIERIKKLSEEQLLAIFEPEGGKVSRTVEGEQVKHTYDGQRPILTEAEAVEFFEVDTERLEVVKAIFNSYPVGQKQRYQVKLITALKKPVFDRVKFLREFLADIPKQTRKSLRRPKNGRAVEIMVTDLHLGKVGFDPEDLSFNWSLQQAQEAALSAVEYFIEKAGPAEQYILPVGNDLINVDGPQNTTTRGTPQMTGEFWQTIFTFGANLCRTIIQRLQEEAPVFVHMVPGNHDRQTVFSLGEVLSAYFENWENVKINNRPLLRKYHYWERVLLQFVHGDEGNAQRLRSAMTTDRPKEFALATYRACHKGHLHKNSRKSVFNLTTKDEVAGVDVEICPTLCPTDRWHYQNLYIGNLRRAKAFVYEPGRLVEELYYTL